MPPYIGRGERANSMAKKVTTDNAMTSAAGAIPERREERGCQAHRRMVRPQPSIPDRGDGPRLYR